MTTPTTRRAIALLVAVLLACAGCGSTTDAVGERETPTGGPPSPAGAKEVTSLPGGEQADTSCDPTASLRPQGTLPGPNDLPLDSTMAKIRQQGKLIVGVDQNTYKFGFRNPITGELEGFDLDMAREIAAAIFGDRNAIQLRVLVSAQRVDAVKNGDVNLVVETMTINCERRKDVEFSSVYYQAGQRVLVKKNSGFTGIDSLGGKKVCAAAESTSLTNIVNSASKPIGVEVPGWTDCLVMLQQNQVDAVSTDDTILAGLAAQDPFTEVVGKPISAEPYGMAIPKDQPDFVRFVNGVLERMRTDGTWTSIYNKWLSDLLGAAPAPPQARYRD